MDAEPLARKLRMRPGDRVLVVGAPDGYADALCALPSGPVVDTEAGRGGGYGVVQVFVTDRLDVNRRTAKALRALREGGVLWFAYPKRASGVATDLTRDRGWDVVLRAGLRPIAQVAVDDVWSALRFRPAADMRR